MNDSGHFFPLWGTCMGFEYLNAFAADAGMDILTELESHNIELTLDWLEDPVTTQMFEDAGADAQAFQTVPFAYQSHTYGVALSAYTTDAGLGAMFTPTSTSSDPNYGSTFVSTMEAKNYPIFGT